jgi:O-antigen/teichoic acid export membrane protein
MFKKILGTIGTRVVMAAMAFFMVILNARILGAENVGTISLVMFSVTIIQLATNFFGGSAILYMTPRVGAAKLFYPALTWTVLVTLAGTLFLRSLNELIPSAEVIPSGYTVGVFLVALSISLASLVMMLLLGQERVKAYNVVNLVQMSVSVILLLMFYFAFRIREVGAYIIAVGASYGSVFLVSLVLLAPSLKRFPAKGLKGVIREVFRFSSYVQFANIFQQLNYRLSYYFVDFFSGRAAVGVLSVGVQISESLWILSRSISTVQYSRISNEMDDAYSAKLTLSLAKVAWIITLAALLVVVVFPPMVFEFVFGPGFGAVKPVILAFSVGIITLSVSMIFSTFFSGINKPWHNTISSAIGLAFTLFFGLILIPAWGIIGAGVTATLSYTATTGYQFLVFFRLTGRSLRDFILRRDEVVLLFRELKNMIGRETPAARIDP